MLTLSAFVIYVRTENRIVDISCACGEIESVAKVFGAAFDHRSISGGKLAGLISRRLATGESKELSGS